MNVEKKHLKIRKLLGPFIDKTGFIGGAFDLYQIRGLLYLSKPLTDMDLIQMSFGEHSDFPLVLLYFLLTIGLLADIQQTIQQLLKNVIGKK